MKRIISLVLLMLICVINAVPSFAALLRHPQANFGKYGIQRQSSLYNYQQKYIGKSIMYIPLKQNGSPEDRAFFLEKGGKFNTKYVITKITGNDKQMIFLLTEYGTKNKVKMVVNNQYEIPKDEESFYCITKEYSIPLILIDDFEEEKTKLLGKVFPNNPNSTIHFEVTNLFLLEQTQEKESSSSDEFTFPSSKTPLYPQVTIELSNKSDGSIKHYPINKVSDFNDFGTTFSNPKYKCTYIVEDIFYKETYSGELKFYKVKNSINGKIKEVAAQKAQVEAFLNDDISSYRATLIKVEKPSDPTVRYGTTTTITDKNITKYSYVDNIIDITICADLTQFNFVIKNISDKTIKIIWNEAVFVDVDGSSSKIMHSGTKYSQRESDQPASTIIRGAKLEDIAVPTNKVYYSDGTKKWECHFLYSSATKDEDNIIRLMLPIQVKDVINEYIFEFELKHYYFYPELIAE